MCCRHSYTAIAVPRAPPLGFCSVALQAMLSSPGRVGRLNGLEQKPLSLCSMDAPTSGQARNGTPATSPLKTQPPTLTEPVSASRNSSSKTGCNPKASNVTRGVLLVMCERPIEIGVLYLHVRESSRLLNAGCSPSSGSSFGFAQARKQTVSEGDSEHDSSQHPTLKTQIRTLSFRRYAVVSKLKCPVFVASEVSGFVNLP